MKPKDYEVIYKFTVASTVPFPSTLNWNAEPIGELIRCKDCKHYSIAENGVNGVCNELFVPFDANEWCSRAKPKESE